MRPFTFSSISRSLMAAGVAVLATTSAACSDAATEPKPVVNVPAAASGIILPQLKYGTVNLIDVWGNNIPESAVVRFWTSPTDSVQVIDNSPQDQDPTIGKVKVALVSSSSYKACAWGWTVNYMAEKNPSVYPNCKTTVAIGGTVNFGNLYMRRKAKIAFYLQSKNGSALPGATVTMNFPNGFPQGVAVADGGQSPLDYDGAVNGSIVFKSAAGEGVHSWCETVAPVGYALASPSCGTITAKFETDYAIVLKHKAL
jgi:hypothetical protein